MSGELATVLDYQEMYDSLDLAANVVTKEYLYSLPMYDICPLTDKFEKLNIIDNTRIYKFSKLVYDKNENTLDKLVTIFNAAYSSKSTVITLIKGHTTHTDYYMGIVNKEEDDLIKKKDEIFRSVFTGNFSGSELTLLSKDDLQGLCDDVFNNNCISSISGIASLRNENNNDFTKYVQGIEHMTDSLQGKEYSIVIIADPVKPDELAMAKSGYEQLFSQLSPFANVTLNLNETETYTTTHTKIKNVAKTIGNSTSRSLNYAESSGWSKSDSEGKTEGTSKNSKLGAFAKALEMACAFIAPAALVDEAAEIFFAAVAGSVGAGAISGIAGTKNESESKTHTETTNYSKSESYGKTETDQKSESTQEGTSEGTSEGKAHSRSREINSTNKTVKDLLEKIDKNIERIIKCESFGAFNCAAYVLSSDSETCEIAASGYNALMRGDNSAWQSSYINTWNNQSFQYDTIKKYLSKFSHPLFICNNTYLSPATLENSYELAISMAVPKKSLSGLAVLECAEFGRDVMTYNAANTDTKNKIYLGNIFHMNRVENNEVLLDKNSLASHTFITGSTGSGKSNTVYKILDNARQKGAKFLVVEPAKGEYKYVFGNDNDVSVYSTNPEISPLLRINPFSFPKGIHILEHLDRLVEIFNVCWPMYAAMPAVLKNAVEKSYEDCGWNLTESENVYGENLYPKFSDVARNVKIIIDSSEYDTDNKGAYKGSLLTRLNSLTNGINGLIFTDDELPAETLFDENVIVDLSRVGSSETKSLIMGMLVLKLQEYRMVQGEMNAPLKHITVLEEAHNLLKRTSTEQTSEGANLLGKSVEMIANAIAEMRTYGEGFIIADQSPGLLDMSVIRNTNTKIIMRLPDLSDRELVGKAANLNDNQITELAKLPCGVAAVYQNEWIQPVLCKIEKYSSSNEGVYTYQRDKSDPAEQKSDDMVPIAELLSNGTKFKPEKILKEILPKLRNNGVDASVQVAVAKLLENPPKEPRMTKLAPIMSAMFPKVKSAVVTAYNDNPEAFEWTNCAELALLNSLTKEKEINDRTRRDIIQAVITDYVYVELGNKADMQKWAENGGLR